MDLDPDAVLVELGAVLVAVQDESPRVLVRLGERIGVEKARSVERGFDACDWLSARTDAMHTNIPVRSRSG